MKQFRIALLIGILSGLSSPFLWADTATDTQDISLNIPQVLLVNIQDAITPTCTYTLPTVAGNNFSTVNCINNTPKIAFTSNETNARLYASALISSTNETLSSRSLKLEITGSSAISAGDVDVVDSEEPIANVGNMASLPLPNTPHFLTIKGKLSSTGQVPSAGTHSVTVTYTLKAS